MDEKKADEYLEGLVIPEKVDSDHYQFDFDVKAQKTLDAFMPLRLLMRLTLRIMSDLRETILLTSAIKVSKSQLPSFHKMCKKSADILQIELPEVFITNNPYMNAYTFGPDSNKATVVFHSSLVNSYSNQELLFIIGHELGHVQCQHVLYRSMVLVIDGFFNDYLKRIPQVKLAMDALRPLVTYQLHSWYHRSEISADRAGLIACQDFEASALSLIKLGMGPLAKEVDVREYIDQIKGMGGVKSSLLSLYELSVNTHPNLPKRVWALDMFKDSHAYNDLIGRTGPGLAVIRDLDEEVQNILKLGTFSAKDFREKVGVETRETAEKVESFLIAQAKAAGRMVKSGKDYIDKKTKPAE